MRERERRDARWMERKHRGPEGRKWVGRGEGGGEMQMKSLNTECLLSSLSLSFLLIPRGAPLPCPFLS